MNFIEGKIYLKPRPPEELVYLGKTSLGYLKFKVNGSNEIKILEENEAKEIIKWKRKKSG